MGDRLLRILPHLEINLSLPETIPADIAAACELVVIVVAYALLQSGSTVARVVADLIENEIAIRFESRSGEYLREYRLPVQKLLDAVQAWRRHYPDAGQDFDPRQRAIAEVAAAFGRSSNG